MTTPILWYLNRGTGVALLVLFTLTVVLGVLSTGRGFTTLWPRFLTQGLHRTLAGLSTGLLLAHALTAVIDEYVDIRWWQAVVPFGATYEPLWLALGTLSLDLTVMVVVTSLLRSRISTRAWFLIHLLSYAAWLAAVVHGLGIGTDATSDWFLATTWVCVAAGVVAVFARIAIGARTLADLRPMTAVNPSIDLPTLSTTGGPR